ncbi:methylated-DNA--[protein]-cysteine S-methyltransferase [Cellulomonas timonensis]|uniref:methylated-DNA--[protein]-cysteine S-methyltransferase n=1 Tax=Cellulomonas timonensis TaxID=1689271 RepID=UPI0009ECD4EA|nr:methylated-DNA--[protein]-cysteine S-methyltransferase [Cellulomonas timonensis]
MNTPLDGAGALPARLLQDAPATLERLRERLADDAQDAGSLDVAYRTLDTAVGPLLLAATDVGLVRVAFGVQDHDLVLDDLARRISPRVLRAPQRLDRAAREIDEYLAGHRRDFDLPLDLRLTSGFRRIVVEHLPRIGYGHTESYTQVATAAGNPKAVRAAGTACALNPLPIVVPCHRVVRSDGTFGNYAGGTDAKRTLLHLESASRP